MTAMGKAFDLKLGDMIIEVTRKNIKHIRMRVARDGAVKVSAPLLCPLSAIEAFVLANRSWIEKARAKAAAAAEADKRNALHDGGTVFLWGRPHSVRVIAENRRSSTTAAADGELIVRLPLAKANAEGLEKAVGAFLAKEVRSALEQGAVERMEKIVGVHAAGWRVRSMTSRWGSCNVVKRTITINSKLAHWPRCCLDYVVCHELCHLIEPSHNARFHALMDRFFPGWKEVRKELRGRPGQIK